VSSKNQETDKMWGLRQGARGYLGKPVTEQDLMQQINDLLGQ
jgi:twitching motility two-component system response regulator PilH